MNKVRTYSELMQLNTFEERFEYLKLNGSVCSQTFGFDRWMNQSFYRSSEWKRLRNSIIIRDSGCDLADPDRSIGSGIIIHHMNPIVLQDLIDQSEWLLNPEYLICVSHQTHNAIHYGDRELLINLPPERSKYDTCPWKKKGEAYV